MHDFTGAQSKWSCGVSTFKWLKSSELTAIHDFTSAFGLLRSAAWILASPDNGLEFFALFNCAPKRPNYLQTPAVGPTGFALTRARRKAPVLGVVELPTFGGFRFAVSHPFRDETAEWMDGHPVDCYL